jgi:hypothetical protein
MCHAGKQTDDGRMMSAMEVLCEDGVAFIAAMDSQPAWNNRDSPHAELKKNVRVLASDRIGDFSFHMFTCCFLFGFCWFCFSWRSL